MRNKTDDERWRLALEEIAVDLQHRAQQATAIEEPLLSYLIDMAMQEARQRLELAK